MTSDILTYSVFITLLKFVLPALFIFWVYILISKND